MATQQDQFEQTTSGPDSSKQQGSGGKSGGKPAYPSQEPPIPAKESPDTIREIPIGSPMPPADWERLKREAEQPKPRPTKKEDKTDGQQDTEHDN